MFVAVGDGHCFHPHQLLPSGGDKMKFSRRDFLRTGAAGAAGGVLARRENLLAYAAAKGVNFKLSAPDWSLQQEAKLDAIGLSKRIGFSGVQISIGHGARG